MLNHQMTNRCSVVLRVDGYNQASAGPGANQGQMMGMSGRGGAIGPEGTANMGSPLMSDNGAMVMYLGKIIKFTAQLYLIFINTVFVEYIKRTVPKRGEKTKSKNIEQSLKRKLYDL